MIFKSTSAPRGRNPVRLTWVLHSSLSQEDTVHIIELGAESFEVGPLGEEPVEQVFSAQLILIQIRE
jgi:hypothetical protein